MELKPSNSQDQQMPSLEQAIHIPKKENTGGPQKPSDQNIKP
jgi:hypothetical protein